MATPELQGVRLDGRKSLSKPHASSPKALRASPPHSKGGQQRETRTAYKSARAPASQGARFRAAALPSPSVAEQPRSLSANMQSSSETVGRCCAEHVQLLEAFRVRTRREAKDVAAALILSEAVYKALDGSLHQAVKDASSIMAGLPEPFRQPLKVQWSLPHVTHRYLIAEGDDGIFVAFMGTKLKADLLTNAKVYQELLWGDQHFKRGQPAAHMGFVRRARSVPTKAFLKLAQLKGKRLVFCGHSLGGSVAEICVLDLLHSSGPGRLPDVQAIGFATPAVGNQALADHVAANGWQHHLTSYLLPEDRIGKLFAFLPTSGPVEALQAAQAATLDGAECLKVDPKVSQVPSKGLNLVAGSFQEQLVAPELPKSNIVPFQISMKAQQIDTKGAMGQRSSYTYMTWAASLLYRTMTFPFWVHKSYVPPARRLYLNPTGISRAPEQSQMAILAAASAAAFRDCKEVLQKAAAEGPSYKVQLMRMHRLPAYRTRFQQIVSQSAIGREYKDPASDRALQLSHSIFPTVAISTAAYCHLTGCSCFGFKDSLLLAAIGGTQPLQKLWAAWSGLGNLRAVAWARAWLERRGLSSADPLCVIVKVRGTGMSHCTSFQLSMPDGQTCKAEVVLSLGASPLQSLGDAISTSTGAAAKELMAWMGVPKKGCLPMKGATRETLILRAKLSRIQAQTLQGVHNRQVQLLWRTDFQEGSIPMQKSAVSVQPAAPVGYSQPDWKLCHKC